MRTGRPFLMSASELLPLCCLPAFPPALPLGPVLAPPRPAMSVLPPPAAPPPAEPPSWKRSSCPLSSCGTIRHCSSADREQTLNQKEALCMR